MVFLQVLPRGGPSSPIVAGYPWACCSSAKIVYLDWGLNQELYMLGGPSPYNLIRGVALLWGRLGLFGSTGGSTGSSAGSSTGGLPSSESFGGRSLPRVDFKCSEVTV